MISMVDSVGTICAQLRAKGIAIPRDNEWLNACIECFSSNNPRHSPEELFDFVYEQWTLADLADVGAGTLPPSCRSCNKMVLTGKYAVQLNYFLDVSTPFHKQLQKIRRPDVTKNLEIDNERQEKEKGQKEKVKCTRSYKIEITDGVTTVFGFEDLPISCFVNAVPGEKAMLSGPLEVRKGVLLLKPANVALLGGEVDTLLIKNATENLLARALKQPENPDPYYVNNPKDPPSVLGLEASLPPARGEDPARAEQPRDPPRRDEPLRIDPPRQKNFIPQDALDDGEDEALASLAEALENESFHNEDSLLCISPDPPNRGTPTNRPISTRLTPPQPVRSNRPTPQQLISSNHPAPQPTTSSNRSTQQQFFNKQDKTKLQTSQSRSSKVTSSQPSKSKQQSITSFLSQTKKSPVVFNVSSSEIDDGFDDDFDMIAAQTASLAEQQAVESMREDPEKLRNELAASFGDSRQTGASSMYEVNSSSSCFGVVGALVSSSRQDCGASRQNKRKDCVEMDVMGRPKIPRSEDSSSPSSDAPAFQNHNHEATRLASPQVTSSTEDEQYDWLPPPQKANLEHVRPSHEAGKVLIDYTDPSTLNLNLVELQNTDNSSSKTSSHRSRVTLGIPEDEPFPPKEFPCSRRTTGKVVKVVNKLQLRDAKWVLTAIVEARGIQLEMDFSSEVLDKIFTVTAEEITRQKEQLKINPALKEKFNGHLRESQKRIQTLNRVMLIHFKNFISKPVVMDVFNDD